MDRIDSYTCKIFLQRESSVVFFLVQSYSEGLE